MECHVWGKEFKRKGHLTSHLTRPNPLAAAPVADNFLHGLSRACEIKATLPGERRQDPQTEGHDGSRMNEPAAEEDESLKELRVDDMSQNFNLGQFDDESVAIDALCFFAIQFAGLSQGLKMSAQRLVYGSNYPFTPPQAVERVTKQADAELRRCFSEAKVQGVCHANIASVLE
ncbi:uncharacterized protein NECHADRAFT_84275 [Fusarium vanettenii 77-13-4]|uniref:Uncharacterized protein n=1 Tax=Fusarium vanettenii (strain ATCC MYA-4622 / CBS 123669 / FGSC 9596 / NRRL 45880 / 77-13-4) TaxID=660122 RepID=C7Z072_FUSV7|nr:uncharacterized protein NECHADRAFT_84275 [Fusarium vanettenii 77-13-4]EEU42735.1 predicted protein [Fusarium vanettenii 77-13-4]